MRFSRRRVAKIAVVVAVLCIAIYAIYMGYESATNPIAKCGARIDYTKTSPEITNGLTLSQKIAQMIIWTHNFTHNDGHNCSDCETNAIIFASLAEQAAIPARIVHDSGENHHWNEVFYKGEWYAVDVGFDNSTPFPSGYNIPRNLYEYQSSPDYPKNISSIYARYLNGTVVDVMRFYTNTSNVVFYVADDQGRPIQGASIAVYSNFLTNWHPALNTNYTAFRVNNGCNESNFFCDSLDTICMSDSLNLCDLATDCVTNSNGTCALELGGNNYTIRAIVPSFLGAALTTDAKTTTIDEGGVYQITLKPTNTEFTLLAVLYLGIIAWLLLTKIATMAVYHFMRKRAMKRKKL